MEQISPEREAELRAKYVRRKKRAKKQAERRKKAQLLSGKDARKRADPALRCKAKTRHSGVPCPCYRAVLEDPQDGKLYRAATCYAHLPPKIRKKFGLGEFGGKVKGATGGNRMGPTKPMQVLREMFEQEVTAWIKPYMDALTATKPVVVGNGRMAHVVKVPDHRTRQAAAEALWDRLYGKPKQATEISGPDGGAIEVQVPDDKNRQKEVAKILAAAGAVDSDNAQDKVAKTIVAASAADRN